MEIKILIVDDEEAVRSLISNYLDRLGYIVQTADGINSAISLLDSDRFDILVVDKNMPGIDKSDEGGMYLLKQVKKQHPEIQVIMMTGYATIETAIEAMKLGAFDYITKPFSNTALKDKISRIIEYRSFINPENTIQTYKVLHDEILDLLENRHILSENEIHEWLKSLDKKLDHFFQAQKQYEKIIIHQRESLGKIGAYAEQLRDSCSEDNKSWAMIEKICAEAHQRI